MSGTRLTTAIIIPLMAIIGVGAESLGQQREAPGESVSLSVHGTFVRGFPMLATVVVQPAGLFDVSGNLWDLGLGGGGLYFEIERNDGLEMGGLSLDQSLSLQPMSLQMPESSRPVTMFMDISIFLRPEGEGLRVKRTRAASVRAYILGAYSDPCQVTVRDPGDEEVRLAESLGASRIRGNWFPTVALSDDPVPDARKLPAETRQIVKLIGILRSAVKSPQHGIKAIDDAKEEWRYLDPLITFIRYECLLKLGRKDDAEKVRSRDPEFGRDLQFNLIDEGKGLVARLQALKAKQQAEKKQSAGP